MLSYFPKNSNHNLLRLTCFFWLSTKILCWKLWLSDRQFPTVPVFSVLHQLPGIVDAVLLTLSTILLVIIFFKKPYIKAILWALLLVEILSCILDQNRWQPWEYQYLFTIGIFIINLKKQQLIPIALAFVLAATYFYSGLNKLNEGFVQTTWNVSILRMFLKIPYQTIINPLVYNAGYLLGILELTMGIGLLFSNTQKAAATILIGMHCFILLLLGPFGLKSNKTVWPWNLAMICYLYFIFLQKKDTIFIKQLYLGFNKLILICWGILPALNFFGLWDNYLSSSLYSGRVPSMKICVSDTTNCKALRQFFFKNDVRKICNGQVLLDLNKWAMMELNSPPYPENRDFKDIQYQLENRYPKAGLRFIYFKNAMDTVGKFRN